MELDVNVSSVTREQYWQEQLAGWKARSEADHEKLED
jgi:hypothetical protein